jgi:hypothetical protein
VAECWNNVYKKQNHGFTYSLFPARRNPACTLSAGRGGTGGHLTDQKVIFEARPVISYGINYNGTKFTDLTYKEDMEQPEWYWVPAIGVCGMTFVSGDRYPNWKGDILSGSLAFEYLSRLKMEGDKVVAEEKLLKNAGRLRDVKMGNDGFIYITVEDPGYVLRLLPVME